MFTKPKISREYDFIGLGNGDLYARENSEEDATGQRVGQGSERERDQSEKIK